MNLGAGTCSKECANEATRQSKLGTKNPMWKGNKVNESTLHIWIRRNYPPTNLCEICDKVPPYDLANITGIYNRKRENWKYLCRHCHMTIDGRMKNLKKGIKTGITKKCPICGKHFYCIQSRKNQICCSKSCRGIFQYQNNNSPIMKYHFNRHTGGIDNLYR